VRGSRGWGEGFYRLTVGGVNLALGIVLLVGVRKYFMLIVPRYGHRFTYVAVIMVGIAGWMVVRGLLHLLGRGGGR